MLTSFWKCQQNLNSLVLIKEKTLEKQSVANQKAEIEFRKKLVLQQIDGENFLKDEFDARSIEDILANRMQKTQKQMTMLTDQQISLSPYLEIGAERCQRSLVMENDICATGIAADISYDMLRACDYYKEVFTKSNIPVRVCCDVNNLPFATDSIPFLFCYETLHHFPNPSPVVKEVHRVLLPGGYFFFDEEPYKQNLHAHLYKKRIHAGGARNRNIIIKILDYFFSETTCNEVDHGIIENHQISVKLWKHALEPFDEKNVTLNSVRIIRSELFDPSSYTNYLLAYLLGGNISGLCKKSGNLVQKTDSIYNLLVCPSCREMNDDIKLERKDTFFACPKCGKVFPVVEGIVFLFSYNKLEELYPEIFKNLSNLL